MPGPFRPRPVTDAPLVRLRELATWPGLPPEALDYVEKRIKDGLDVNEAYNLIGQYGARIQALKADPVGAMAKEVKRLKEAS